MQRKPLFLAAAVAESARFFALSFLADALGGLHGGGGLAPLFRYASSAQLLFGVAFFFLWFDQQRYDVFRPLLFVGKILALATQIPLALALIRNIPALSMGGRSGPVSALLCLAVDLFSFSILLGSGPLSRASFEGQDPASREQFGPRGPEDIEDVED